MPTVRKLDFARLCHRSPAAITKAIASGRVVLTGDLVDTDHPVNLAYIAACQAAKASAAPKASRDGRKPHRGPRVEPPEDLEGGALFTRKLRAEIGHKVEQTAAIRQRRLERVGLLLEAAAVDRRLALMGQEVKTRLLNLPTRAFPQVAALVKAGREEEALAHLEHEISEALERIVEATTA